MVRLDTGDSDDLPAPEEATQVSPPDLSQLTLSQSPPTSISPPHPNSAKPDGPKQSDPFAFGSRFLNPTDDVFDFNAWDHVETTDEYKAYSETQYTKQRQRPVCDFDKRRFNADPARWWNQFYKNNRENFFKDRKWLSQEFPILASATAAGTPAINIVELGCGAGNTLFPILAMNNNEGFHIHGADFSKKAVEIIKAQPLYIENLAKGRVSASVYDLSAPDSLPEGITEGSVDVVIMVFVFSALAPSQWTPALANVKRMLKTGGKVLFRDYGRGDLAQVRFKEGRYLEENFYVRGDGTRVYFFDEEELGIIFATGGSNNNSSSSSRGEDDNDDDDAAESNTSSSSGGGGGGFKTAEIGVDRRLLVNRKRQLKMYRCWMQAVFEKYI